MLLRHDRMLILAGSRAQTGTAEKEQQSRDDDATKNTNVRLKYSANIGDIIAGGDILLR